MKPTFENWLHMIKNMERVEEYVISDVAWKDGKILAMVTYTDETKKEVADIYVKGC
jgi:hypothetical protein